MEVDHRVLVFNDQKEKDMNYQMEVFHQQMIDLINHSGLPIGTAYFIVKDCLNELEMGYRKAIFNEKDAAPETVTEEYPVAKVENEEEKNE